MQAIVRGVRIPQKRVRSGLKLALIAIGHSMWRHIGLRAVERRRECKKVAQQHWKLRSRVSPEVCLPEG